MPDVEERDWKDVISDILKGEGLEVAEDMAVATVRGVMKALPKIADAIPGEIDDMVISILVAMEPKILSMLDKIDGIDDPNY
jgi:hypothetical protein